MKLRDIAKKYGATRRTVYYTLEKLEFTKGYQFTKGKKGVYELTNDEAKILTETLEDKGFKEVERV